LIAGMIWVYACPACAPTNTDNTLPQSVTIKQIPVTIELPVTGNTITEHPTSHIILVHSKLPTNNIQMENWLKKMPATLSDVQNIDKKDRRAIICLAMTIYHESRGSILNEQLAVAHVAMNRTKTVEYGGDVCSTVFQYQLIHGRKRPQFSWTTDNPSSPKEQEVWLRMQKIASVVYLGKTRDITNGAIYFHDRKLRPSWSMASIGKLNIGTSVFFRLQLPS